MPLFESETLRGYQYHQQNQTKLRNYYYWNQKILKNVIAPYLEKETTKKLHFLSHSFNLSDLVFSKGPFWYVQKLCVPK